MSITMKSSQFLFYDRILDENTVRKKGFGWPVV